MNKTKRNLFSATHSVAKKGTVAMLCMILFGLISIAGCKKDSSITFDANIEDIEITLQSTVWKLSGFVDAETGEMKKVEPANEECYLIKFLKDNDLLGFSSTNELHGNYKIIDSNRIQIHINASTEICELFDGLLYVEYLKNVQFFELNENKLLLFYDEGKKYMLFRQKAEYLELKMNETSLVPHSNNKITISFTGVADSRCPWSACYLCYGSRAEVYLNITDSLSKSESVFLWVHGCVIDSDDDFTPYLLEMLGYRFQVVNLSPYPDYGTIINEDDYIAKIKIMKL